MSECNQIPRTRIQSTLCDESGPKVTKNSFDPKVRSFVCHLLDHIFKNNHIETTSNKNAQNCQHHLDIHFSGLDSVSIILQRKTTEQRRSRVPNSQHQFDQTCPRFQCTQECICTQCVTKKSWSLTCLYHRLQYTWKIRIKEHKHTFAKNTISNNVETFQQNLSSF